MVPTSVGAHRLVYVPQHMSQAEITEILGNPKVFSFPKPTGLVTHLVQFLHPDKDAIILDFFAGSGTTAHATILLNAADEGRRKFVLIQLPEPLDPDDGNQKDAVVFCKESMNVNI